MFKGIGYKTGWRGKKAARLLFIIQPGAESGANDVLTAAHTSKKKKSVSCNVLWAVT